MSLAVISPMQRDLPVHHRQARDVVLGHQRQRVAQRIARRDGDHVALHDVGSDQLAERRMAMIALRIAR